MTECNQCGDCCEVITSAWNKTRIRRANIQDKAFYLQHWHRISRREAFYRRPILADDPGENTVYYECDQWDAVTRQCLAHDHKPQACRGFPWYGETPEDWRLRHLPRCSFWQDIPETEGPDIVELARAQTLA